MPGGVNIGFNKLPTGVTPTTASADGTQGQAVMGYTETGTAGGCVMVYVGSDETPGIVNMANGYTGPSYVASIDNILAVSSFVCDSGTTCTYNIKYTIAGKTYTTSGTVVGA